MILLTASQRYDYVVSWCIGHRTMKETQAQGSGAGWSQVMLGLIASNAQANLDAVVHASWWISSPVVSLKIGLIISFTLLPLSSGCPFVWPTGHVTFITIFLSVQTPSTSPLIATHVVLLLACPFLLTNILMRCDHISNMAMSFIWSALVDISFGTCMTPWPSLRSADKGTCLPHVSECKTCFIYSPTS